ncbi:MAG: DUF4405 domain-containing protein [Chloroflexota bacterium]
MTETITKTKNQTKTKLVIDVAIFIAFLIAMDPRSSGIAVHEWLATAALGAIVVHLLLSWDWIIQTSRRIIGKMNNQARINYVLNWAMFFDVTILMLSGFVISKAVMPALGIALPQNFAWRPLHDLSANLFLVLLGLHTALHWSWVVDTCKRYIFQPIVRLFTAKSRKDIPA